MSGLTLADIVDQRAYEREREDFRREVIALKKLRRLQLGPILSVVFENRTTIRFQVQEMARAERMLADEQIQEELDTYNPLIPGRGELSMTLFVELTSEPELREWLPKLVGIETSVVLRIGSGATLMEVRSVVDPAHASLLTREAVTASVHYVRIELSPALAERFTTDQAVLAVDHPSYEHATELSGATKASLTADWSQSAR
ncbi:MAG: uncharacterized protein JWO62_1803 [Acidimicrobiaceae bacterium]|nr:uncharacterized protein [Acidimicrobiaceae bacterium]